MMIHLTWFFYVDETFGAGRPWYHISDNGIGMQPDWTQDETWSVPSLWIWIWIWGDVLTSFDGSSRSRLIASRSTVDMSLSLGMYVSVIPQQSGIETMINKSLIEIWWIQMLQIWDLYFREPQFSHRRRFQTLYLRIRLNLMETIRVISYYRC